MSLRPRVQGLLKDRLLQEQQEPPDRGQARRTRPGQPNLLALSDTEIGDVLSYLDRCLGAGQDRDHHGQDQAGRGMPDPAGLTWIHHRGQRDRDTLGFTLRDIGADMLGS
jgi:hypothetical protein